ncbi:hypothetical protein F2Q70_00035334 [Brassica cretica]|uniref:Uncharacterized protein n=1 Tax=Brassica cretica TaxID=69181 RepID=A0A8S9JUF8_BRACR|nr:hypothetical protein F2Q68_00030468 [Brassica cretica]KAF2584973.1 hypothetical protein F2Q70_00035334 [Brassica cretica]
MTSSDEKHRMVQPWLTGDSIKEYTRMFGFVSYPRSGRVRSLRNGLSSVATYRAVCVLSHYVSSRVRARSLRSDRAMCVLDRYVATELGLCVVRLPYSILSVAGLDTCLLPWDNRYLVRSRLEEAFTARLFVKIFFTKNHFRRKCSC